MSFLYFAPGLKCLEKIGFIFITINAMYVTWCFVAHKWLWLKYELSSESMVGKMFLKEMLLLCGCRSYQILLQMGVSYI